MLRNKISSQSIIGAFLCGLFAIWAWNFSQVQMLSSLARRMSSQQAFNRPLLAELHNWWLQGVPEQQDQPVPGETFKRWFTSDAAVDQLCSEKYGPAVLEAGQMSAEEIAKVAKTHEDAVSVILLLDQMPRNIFRGKEASKVGKIPRTKLISQVYNDYDPKAAKLAKLYLKDQGYAKRDEFTNFGRGMFLYMPLMHSESMADHELFASMLKERLAACQSDVEREGVQRIAAFEEKHRAVLEKFGRYPSRNEALGRESTPEEIEHLKDGPGW